MEKRAESLVPLLRRGLLGLAALTTAGITLELITERHWTQRTQLIAWAALALLALAIALLLGQPSVTRVRTAQIFALIVVVSALIGVWQHIAANHEEARSTTATHRPGRECRRRHAGGSPLAKRSAHPRHSPPAHSPRPRSASYSPPCSTRQQPGRIHCRTAQQLRIPTRR